MLKHKGHMNLKLSNKEAKNPYLLSYLSFALICTISLGMKNLVSILQNLKIRCLRICTGKCRLL